jgi:Leucine zipper with capping helix domain
LLLHSEFVELKKQQDLVQKELDKYREMDPDLFEARKKILNDTNISINMWTENIFTLQSYCANKFNIARSDFNTQFGIPEELDYV